MSFFRSERMALCRLVLHEEYAFDCLVKLGYVGQVQFVHDDEHPPNDKFIGEIRRCLAVRSSLKHLQEEINKAGMHTVFYEYADKEEPKQHELPEIERLVQQLDDELNDVQANCEALQRRRLELYEHVQVLERCNKFLKTGQMSMASLGFGPQIQQSSSLEELGLATHKADSPLYFISGSMPAERFAAFELMLYRVTLGMYYIDQADFTLPPELAARSMESNYKYAFMLAVVGKHMQVKVNKICSGFQMRLFKCARSSTERAAHLQNIKADLQRLEEIFRRSCEHKKRVLYAASVDLFLWRAKINKMLQVYELMNQCNSVHASVLQFSKYLKADCWVPHNEIDKVRETLMQGSRVAAGGMSVLTFPPMLLVRKSSHHMKAPTYFRTNKFTNGFQNLINAYGMASYRELNPAPYTIVTFPFLFAVMFGDVGHGILLTLFAAALVLSEKKIARKQKLALKSSEIFDLLFAGRYIMLLMGIFSIYTGIIYNEVFSMPLNIFGSSWHVDFTASQVLGRHTVKLDPSNPAHYTGTPYIMGFDPVWTDIAENAIRLSNSIKMKMAIILGVFQMIFGLTLSALNARFFHSKVDLYLVFLPRLMFLTCLFLYLVVLIFYKWAVFGGLSEGAHSVGCAPSILNTFIGMIMMKDVQMSPKGCKSMMFTGQLVLQHVLLFVALAAVPVLLLGKPLCLMSQHRRVSKVKDPEEQEELRRSTMHSLKRSLIYHIHLGESDLFLNNEAEDKLSEVWIHQGIHTIECVLGSVSHTASYLRLWALSLAHSQLSGVLWSMVLSKTSFRMNFGFYNSIVLFFCFAVFAVLTVAILVVMEGLSAFLHTLRLHWVEFQSKFFAGEGEQFSPFYFEPSRRRDSYR